MIVKGGFMARKGRNIFKRKDGRWEARYIKNRNFDGKIVYGFCYGKTYNEAKQKQQKAISMSITNKKTATHRGKVFADYQSEWLEIRKTRLKESSILRYAEYLNNQILPFFKNLSIQQISSHMVAIFTQKLYADGLSKQTIKGTLVVLNSIFKYIAKENGFYGELAEIVYPKENHKTPKVFDESEQTRLLKYIVSHKLNYGTLAIAISLYVGLRIGEVCGLKWSDFDFHSKTIAISQTVQRIRTLNSQSYKTKVVVTSPKTETSTRIIPLPDTLVAFLNPPQNLNTYVLTNNEKPIEPRRLQYKIKTIFAECGIEDGHFHTLRHTFTTMCGKSHFEIKALSEILGHKKPNITLEMYMHPSMQLKKENMSNLENIFCNLSSQNAQSLAKKDL